MSTRVTVSLMCLVACTVLLSTGPASAQPRSEYFLPKTTKMLLSLPDPDEAREKFNASQLGELFNHDDMADFMDDLEEQLKDDGRMAERLGISPRDLDGVYDGEVALAAIQPGGDREQFATALIVKIKPGDPEGTAQKMLGEVVKRRLAKFDGSSTAFLDIDAKREREVYRLTTPADGKLAPVATHYFFQGTYFVAVDHEEEAKAIYKRIADVTSKKIERPEDSLAADMAFVTTQLRVADAWGDGSPQLRWFVDPFDYMRLRQTEQLAFGEREPRRGRDMIDVYADEGFDAIQGVGGWVNFSESGHEVLHRTFVYAPAVNRMAKDPTTVARLKIEKKMSEIPEGVTYAGPENNKYLLGARMMHFFNGAKLKTLDWVPDDVASQMAFHWHMQRAFKYSETLVNAYSDDVKNQEVWWGTIDSIRDDDDGPKTDIRKDIVMQMGTRATNITQYVQPIDVDSEESAVAMEITGDADTVSAALDKMMANDSDAKKRTVSERTIWEIVPPPPAAVGAAEESQPASYMVAYGHLFRATHAGILKRLATMPAKQLSAAKDLAEVNAALDELSGGKESFRYFDRLDQSQELNWELIRQGKFPQSNSMLADMAARSQGFDPADPETKERDQQIDGTNLPEFEFAKPFLGPSGFYVETVDDGWLVTGAVLTKK